MKSVSHHVNATRSQVVTRFEIGAGASLLLLTAIRSYHSLQKYNVMSKYHSFQPYSNFTVCFRSAVNGNWSREGCSLEKSDDNKIICTCNHLTNFAVLMQVGENEVCSEQVTTPSKLKCGVPIWENSEPYWYLLRRNCVLPKGLANSKEKNKRSVESTRSNTSNFPIPS